MKMLVIIGSLFLASPLLASSLLVGEVTAIEGNVAPPSLMIGDAVFVGLDFSGTNLQRGGELVVIGSEGGRGYRMNVGGNFLTSIETGSIHHSISIPSGSSTLLDLSGFRWISGDEPNGIHRESLEYGSPLVGGYGIVELSTRWSDVRLADFQGLETADASFLNGTGKLTWGDSVPVPIGGGIVGFSNYYAVTFDISAIQLVPEPSSVACLSTFCLLLIFRRSRK